jgi:hypothetical protein
VEIRQTFRICVSPFGSIDPDPSFSENASHK